MCFASSHPLRPFVNLFQDRNFIQVTLADFLVRAAYQMGKTPLLPIFAAALGASDVLLGLIVSVSTVTGMVAKPLVGLLSDRWGRKLWLLIGTAFFAFTPFAYWLIQTPEQLVAIRIIHGTATAIYGPVTLAFVAEQAGERRAEKLGWFSNARSLGYIVGPALGGFLLLWVSPQWVFTAIGAVSLLAFVPVVGIRDDERMHFRPKLSWSKQIKTALHNSSNSSAVWLSGGIEAMSYVGLYALRAFLPLYALGEGWNSAEIGTFFAVQEAANIVCKPIGGRLADRFGKHMLITIGTLGLALTLPMVAIATTLWQMLLITAATGVWQAILFPATTALVADQIDPQNLGVGMGVVGTLRNAGKVAGPLIGGVLLAYFDFSHSFIAIAIILVLGSAVLLLWGISSPQFPKTERYYGSSAD
ncbi:MAG: MFS transporter [Candidatus Promineifilaceae bacterium]